MNKCEFTKHKSSYIAVFTMDPDTFASTGGVLTPSLMFDVLSSELYGHNTVAIIYRNGKRCHRDARRFWCLRRSAPTS